MTGGLAAAGGGVGVFDGPTLKDAVAYGSASSTHPFIEGTIPANQSAARSPNGKDTNNNATDFKIAVRTAGAAN